MLYGQFHFEHESPVNYVFTNWKWTYILDFGPWSWGALNMEFMNKAAFKNARATSFWSRSGQAMFFGWVKEKSMFFPQGHPRVTSHRPHPQSYLQPLPLKVRRGRVNGPLWQLAKERRNYCIWTYLSSIQHKSLEIMRSSEGWFDT